MLLVKQLNVSYRECVIGRFDNLRQIYNYFHRHNTAGWGFNVYKRFSFNPRELYYSGYYGIDPIFCMTIQTENGIRYSSELIKGMFLKFQKEDKQYQWKSYYFYGYKRHFRGKSHRHPKTIQERRMAVNVIEEDGEPKWRGSRGYHGLPSSWDDIPLYDVYNRNWKRFRKTQWK